MPAVPSRPLRRPPTKKKSPRPLQPTRLPAASKPLWLAGLVVLQRATTVVAIGTIGLTIGAYAMTVCQWQAWNRADRHLEDLRYQERSLLRASAGLERELAQAAERSPLVLWDPKKTLFLKPVPVPTFADPPDPTDVPMAQPDPLAY